MLRTSALHRLLWLSGHRASITNLRCEKLAVRLVLLQPPCQGCQRRNFSRQQSDSSSRTPLLSWLPMYGGRRSMASILGGTGDQNDKPSKEGVTGAGAGAQTVAPKSDSTSSEGITPSDTIVKVQHTAKSKQTQRQKIDFNKVFSDNITITPVRAMSEYLLTMDDLQDLPTIKRRSPFPEKEDIIVYQRNDIVRKALLQWGSLENLEKEHKRIAWQKKIEALKYLESAADPTRSGTATANELQEGQSSIYKSGPGKVVLWAIIVNATNALLKFVTWLYTGSHSMFSECIHSIADTANQIILAIGINQSLKKADLEHPYGWANFRNVASLISGVGIFCLGAGFSIYHGIQGIIHPEAISSLYWTLGYPLVTVVEIVVFLLQAIAILGGSFLSEGGTLLIAVNQIRTAAKAEKVSFMNYVWHGHDPCTNVVLMEDAASVLGVSIASVCMSITYFTGNPMADAIGSLLIGSLLGGVASFIIYTNTISLVGRSIPYEHRAQLMQELENDRMIRALHDVKATDIGSSYIRFKAEVDFDGREITRFYLQKQDLEALFSDIRGMNTPEELENFMLKHGNEIIDTLGGEVDRIEKNLKKKHPQVRHVDLEQL